MARPLLRDSLIALVLGHVEDEEENAEDEEERKTDDLPILGEWGIVVALENNEDEEEATFAVGRNPAEKNFGIARVIPEEFG